MINITEKQQRKKADAAIQYILTRAGIVYDFYVTDVVNPGRHCPEAATPLLQKRHAWMRYPFEAEPFRIVHYGE